MRGQKGDKKTGKEKPPVSAVSLQLEQLLYTIHQIIKERIITTVQFKYDMYCSKLRNYSETKI